MRCTILASGSKGNCIYVEGEGGALLIDAGLSARETLSRLTCAGARPDCIHAILVTHEHADHLKGLDVLARHLEVPVYATEGTLGEFLHIRRRSAKSVETRRCRYGERITLDGFTVEPFATSHDAREPCGFTIEEGGLRMGCCTDTGVITNAMREVLKRCDSLILESNHSTEMLAHGPYPEMLKRRIRSRVGHLSNEAARQFLHELSGDLQTVILAHLSEVNNTPEKALASGREGLGLYYNDVPLHVASMITHPACWEQWIEI